MNQESNMANPRFIIDDMEIGFSFIDKNPETKKRIRENIPLEGNASKWGNEIYFDTGIDIPEEDTQTEIPVGGVAFWPSGNAVCIFWGATPASNNDEPRAAGPVNLFGEIEDVDKMRDLQSGVSVRFE